MKLFLTLVVSISVAAAQDGSFIRGGSSAGLANSPNNNFTPEEYCPQGTTYNQNGPEWPPEAGCYPGTGSIAEGYPKCCDKGNCPNNQRPLCENSMAGAPDYCANMAPDESCYVGGWPMCCLTDGLNCPNSVPGCNNGGNRRNCSSSSVCDSDEFCLKQAGNCGQIGVCVPRPEVCSSNYNPVCGCDDRTYSNACVASANARVSIKYYGECYSDDRYDDDDGPNRGQCRSNSNCQSDEYCDFPVGDCGDSSRGECKSIPSGADCDGFPNSKVCGCDDVQYKNSCKANQSSTSIQNTGGCSNLAFE